MTLLNINYPRRWWFVAFKTSFAVAKGISAVYYTYEYVYIIFIHRERERERGAKDFTSIIRIKRCRPEQLFICNYIVLGYHNGSRQWATLFAPRPSRYRVQWNIIFICRLVSVVTPRLRWVERRIFSVIVKGDSTRRMLLYTCLRILEREVFSAYVRVLCFKTIFAF